MHTAPVAQFSMQVEAVDGAFDGAGAVEEFALDLRRELSDLGVSRVDQVPVGTAPDGTRAFEILGICAFVITAVQTGEALARVMAAIRTVAARFAQRRQRVRVRVAGRDVDLAATDDSGLSAVVRSLLGQPALTPMGVRDALIVANSRYDDTGLSRLRSPGHDAEALQRVLGDVAIGGFNVELLADADERTIRRRVAAFFANRSREDLLLLHFSCHGVKDTRGRLHLAARDTDLSVLGATAIPATFVNDVMAESQSRRVVLVLDCCYSGAFARGADVRAGSDVQIADEFGAGTGRVVLTASSATEYAFEGGELTRSEGQPSAFTSAMVAGLEEGAADLDADGEITIDELYDFTYRRVRDTTPGQAPMKWSFGVEGSLPIARSLRPAALPRQIEDDLTSDRVILRLEAVKSLAQILRGNRAQLAAAALAALTGLHTHDDSMQVRRAAGDALATATGVQPPSVPQPAAVRPTERSAVAPPPPPEPATAAPAPVRATPPVEPAPVASPPAAVASPPAAVASPPVPTPRVEPPVVPTSRVEPGPAAVPGSGPPAPVALAEGDSARATGVLIGAAFVVVLSVLAYLIGNPWDADGWADGLSWFAELGAVALLLVTRQVRFGAFLAGLLAWELPLATLVSRDEVRDAMPKWDIYMLGSIVGVIALLLTIAGLQPVWARMRPSGPRRRVLAVVVGLLAIVATVSTVEGLRYAFDLYADVRPALRWGAAIVSALIVAAAVLARSGAMVVGWLFGGLQMTAAATANDGLYAESNKAGIVAMVILLAVTAGAAALAGRLDPEPPVA